MEQIRESEEESLIIEEKELDISEEKKNKALEKAEKLAGNAKGGIDKNPAESFEDLLSNEESSQNNGEEEEDLIDEDHNLENSSFFELKLKPKKIYKFNLIFHPQNIRTYNFLLPLSLNGFKEFSNLQKKITCHAVAPRIILDPIDGVRDFKKKVITNMDGSSPDIQIVTISNPSPNEQLRYFIDNNSVEESKSFLLDKTEGVVPPGQSIDIEIEFRPNVPGVWNFKLPIYIDEDHRNSKADIILKGESAFPRILFDRREIIMPIVPLTVESRISFYLYNDGYPTVNLTAYISESFQHFPIEIHYPDGHSLTSRKQKVKLELSFKSKIPMSFTTILYIEDDQKTAYNIFVSGTTDNCILTTYDYFFRTPTEDYQITAFDEKPINIKFPEVNKSEKSEKLSVDYSKMSSATNNQLSLGYTPATIEQLSRACKHMENFVNVFIPGVSITSFPLDPINKNGEPLIKAVEFFGKTTFNMKTKLNPDMKKVDKIEILYSQYMTIINFLKREGALLNNIRPEYLFGWSDLLVYYKKNPIASAHQRSSRIGESSHKYMSSVSWLLIFNQLLKIYFLARVNLAKLKTMPSMGEYSKKLPNGYSDLSPLISHSEMILLRWCEGALEKIHEQKKRLNFLDSSFKSGIPIG